MKIVTKDRPPPSFPRAMRTIITNLANGYCCCQTHTHTHTPCPTKRKIKVNEAKIINLFPLFNAPHQRRNNPFRVFLLKIWEDTRLRTYHPSGLKSEEDRSNFHFLSKGLKGIIRASLLNSFNYTIISLSKIIRLGTNNLSIIPQLH